MVWTVDWAAARQKERDACVALLDERIACAAQICSDHAADPIEVRRELDGYLRGLRDAAFALRERKG